jgi:hypothetical protein
MALVPSAQELVWYKILTPESPSGRTWGPLCTLRLLPRSIDSLGIPGPEQPSPHHEGQL